MTEISENQYYVPHKAKWPIVACLGLFITVIGASLKFNNLDSEPGTPWLMYLGFAILIVMFFGWFGEVIKESEAKLYNKQVDASFRDGMMWFIFSEVMFFAAFFGALFYVRTFAVPWLGGAGTNLSTNIELWNGYEAVWPTNGPADMNGRFETISAFSLPLVTTLLLLTSSITITIAHHALRDNDRKKTIIWMIATVLLGATFLFYQAEEYIEAYQHLNLTLKSGIYGATFFMLTGFHGMHVTLGTIMLIVITIRLIKGHFSKDNHFGFEAVAWYWHFVDVVWLGLFIFVYVL